MDREMQNNSEVIEGLIKFKNRLSEGMERSAVLDFFHTKVSDILHPRWFGLKLLDEGRVINEYTIYTRGKYYERYEEGIRDFVRIYFKINRSFLERQIERTEELASHPWKVVKLLPYIKLGVRLKSRSQVTGSR